MDKESVDPGSGDTGTTLDQGLATPVVQGWSCVGGWQSNTSWSGRALGRRQPGQAGATAAVDGWV